MEKGKELLKEKEYDIEDILHTYTVPILEWSWPHFVLLEILSMGLEI